jgi:hypothetical protein
MVADVTLSQLPRAGDVVEYPPVPDIVYNKKFLYKSLGYIYRKLYYFV